LLWFEGSGSSDKHWMYTNYQGSVIATTDWYGNKSEIYKYGAYGEPKNGFNQTSFTGESRFRYTGQTILPDAQLYYYKARVYDPQMGRFLQTDPIGSADDLNLYAYVGGDPINGSDPTGLQEAAPKLPTADWFGTRLLGRSGAEAKYLTFRYIEELVKFGVTGVLAEGAGGVLGAMANGGRVAAGTATVVSAEAAADAALLAGRTSGAAAELRVGNKVYTGVSGEVVPHTDEVTGGLMGTPKDKRAPWHGGCAEVVCADKAIADGTDPAGGKMRTVNIGESGGGHNTPKEPCSSCKDMMDFLRIPY
jgi:RHS repeat-associated protein